MNKLLIVEDEKMIRQGIKSIAERSSVPIGEILLCKNGEEAIEIIKNNKIDVMITDIRMPKKDGITLVKEIQNFHHVPKVTVISGYDDFSFAVELLRYGVKEYLLKPIEREKINAILEKLERQLKEEEKQVKDSAQIGIQQLKYMLLNPGITKDEIYAIEKEFEKYFVSGEYVVCCTNSRSIPMISNTQVILLEDVNGQNIYLINTEIKEMIFNNLLKDHFVGISKSYKNIRDLKNAYEEALHARKCAFITGDSIKEYSKTKTNHESGLEEVALIDSIVQLVGTDKIEDVKEFLANVLSKTKQGQIMPDDFMEIMNKLVDNICDNYKNVLDFENVEIENLKKGYIFDDVTLYYEVFYEWIKHINEKIMTEYDDYKNKQKIQKAIGYIQKNYAKDLNMAVVSNHVSMNYSLFSYVFKQFSGMNFVNYLKEIRMKEAKRLLEKTDKKIIEVSNAVGYENEKHFMKIFKNTTGVSPTEYRKNAQIGKQNTVS